MINNTFRETLIDIRRKKENLENGIVNSIPYPFKSLNKIFPGIVPETQQMLTTVSGAGKSKLARFMYVQEPFNFWINNKSHKDIDIKVFYFSLEDSKSQAMKLFIANALYTQKNIRINPMKLDSYFEEDKLDDKILREIESLDPYFETFLSKVEIIDNVRTPNGILNKVRDYMLNPKIGNHATLNNEIIPREKIKEAIENKVEVKYLSNHPNRVVIVLTDNLQNVEPDKEDGGSKYAALDRYTRSILRNKLCNYYKTCNAFIQQQNQSKESQQYTNTGASIIEKLYPSLDGLGEFKNSVQTAHVCYGLFNPSRYKIDSYSTDGKSFYDINKLGDKFRSIRILKSNFAESNIELTLYFDGMTGDWFQLPRADDKFEMEKIYSMAESMDFSNYSQNNPSLFG